MQVIGGYLHGTSGARSAQTDIQQTINPPTYKMEKVTGIGGFFFRVKNADVLNAWYEQHLGVRKVGERDEDGSWWQDAGPTVFASESASDQAGGPEYEWRINFRVRDLDAMVAQLREAGAAVEVEDTIYPNGRFAHLRDPEGNRIELWEPAGADLVRPPDQRAQTSWQKDGWQKMIFSDLNFFASRFGHQLLFIPPFSAAAFGCCRTLLLQTGRSWQQNGGSRMLRFKAILLPSFCCHKNGRTGSQGLLSPR
jgi:glyoxylase I family protein